MPNRLDGFESNAEEHCHPDACARAACGGVAAPCCACWRQGAGHQLLGQRIAYNCIGLYCDIHCLQKGQTALQVIVYSG